MKKIDVPTMGWFAKLGDFLMIPLMYLLSGTFKERPQRTHHWNCIGLKQSNVDHLNPIEMFFCDGVKASPRRIFFFHMPIFGGWKKYVVLRPKEMENWHIGWITDDKKIIGVSKIILSGSVRMLVGNKNVQFFGVNELGEQIEINKIGEGTIGDNGPHSQRPLL